MTGSLCFLCRNSSERRAASDPFFHQGSPQFVWKNAVISAVALLIVCPFSGRLQIQNSHL